MSDVKDLIPEPPKSVFISYARADRPRVAAIAEAVTRAGYNVWWDALIDGGAEFARLIEQNLASADATVVVWSKNSVGSDWVRDEAAYARDRKCLVPVSLDGTEPPLGFRQYHSIDLSKWRGAASDPEMLAIVRGVEALSSPIPPARPPEKTQFSGSTTRRKVLLGSSLVAATAAGGGLIAFRPWSDGKTNSSIAVLPFANLSGDPSQAYFSDGLSEEVRAALSRNAQLKVAAPTSSALFRGMTGDAKSIATKLGVGFLLEGSVRKSGDVVRISANLIDALTGFSSWSQTFDRKLVDVFAVQSEIANTVAEALTVRVGSSVSTPGSTKNVAAYDAFLKGRELYNADAGESSDRGALAQFDVALTLDPKYASAHAARSRSLADVASSYAPANQLRAMYDAAIAAAKEAISIAPDLAIAHWALGNALFYGKLDPKDARAPYDRAHMLGKGDADVSIAFAHFCIRTGRTGDAQAAIQTALSLDPLNPRAFRAAGLIELTNGKTEEALALFARALEQSPKLAFVQAQIATANLRLNKLAEARAAYAAEPIEIFRLSGLAIVDRKMGNLAAANQSFATLIKSAGDSALYQQAEVLAQWGDTAGAMTALHRAVTVGDSGLTTLLIDPLLDPLRSDPEFSNLLKRLGFA